MAVAPTLLGGQYKERRQPRASAAGRTSLSVLDAGGGVPLPARRLESGASFGAAQVSRDVVAGVAPSASPLHAESMREHFRHQGVAVECRFKHFGRGRAQAVPTDVDLLAGMNLPPWTVDFDSSPESGPQLPVRPVPHLQTLPFVDLDLLQALHGGHALETALGSLCGWPIRSTDD